MGRGEIGVKVICLLCFRVWAQLIVGGECSESAWHMSLCTDSTLSPVPLSGLTWSNVLTGWRPPGDPVQFEASCKGLSRLHRDQQALRHLGTHTTRIRTELETMCTHACRPEATRTHTLKRRPDEEEAM
jgi:hypothetical protein